MSLTRTSTSSLLEDLRAALYGAPSVQGWLSVCNLIDSAIQADDLDDDGLRLALDYASRLAVPWPDRLRVAPQAWCAALTLEQPPAPDACLRWSLIRHLDLTGDKRAAQIGRVIASSDLLARVTILTLDKVKLGIHGARAISRADSLAALTHLSMRDAGIGPQEIRALINAGLARNLTHLDLADNALRANALRALATSRLDRLTHLDLSHNRLADACSPHLLAWPRLPHLQALDLSHNTLAYHAARQIAGSVSLRCDLDLSHNRLRDTNAAALTEGNDPQRRAERVNELLDAEPDLANWQSLCTIFDVWPTTDHEALRQLIADNAPRFDRWPDALRTPQPRWIRSLMEELNTHIEPAPPQWATVRALSCAQFFRYGVQPFPWLPDMVGRLARRLDDLALTHLDLSSIPTDAAQISALLARPASAALRQLRINGQHLGLPLALALTESPHLTFLEDLSLEGQNLPPEVVEILFRDNHFDNITRLNLAYNPLLDDGAMALARSPHLSRLTCLTLSNTTIREPGALALAEAASLNALTRLDLNSCFIPMRGVAALLAPPALPSLQILDLSTSGLISGPDPSATPRPSPLIALDLSNRRLTDDDLKALLDAAHLDRLEHLCLSFNALTCRAAEILASNPRLGALKRLRLDNNGISDEGARALADSPHLRNLALLSLGSNKIQTRGALALISAHGLPAMTHLNLYLNPIPDSIARDLKDLSPASSLARLYLPQLWASHYQPNDSALADSLHMSHIQTGNDPTWQLPFIPR